MTENAASPNVLEDLSIHNIFIVELLPCVLKNQRLNSTSTNSYEIIKSFKTFSEMDFKTCIE